MNLMFDSIAVFDEKADAVKFAGRYVNGQGFERFIICRVTREFLLARCDIAEASGEHVLELYWSIRSEVNALATRQFAQGEIKPFTGLQHFMREFSEDTPSPNKDR